MSTLDMRSLMNRLNSVVENAPFEDDSKKNVFESFTRWGVTESEDGKAVEGEVTDGTEDGTLDECDKSDVKEGDDEEDDSGKEEITEGLSPSKLKALGKEFSNYAGEEVEVKQIKGAIYAFGSELACYRILMKYRFSEKARAGYSENLRSWYFSLETNL